MAGAWYRGRAELRRRWPALLVVGVLVGVVGGVTSAAVAGARRTASSYDRFRSETNADDAFLQATGIDERAVQEVLALPQVASWSRGSLYIGDAGIEQDFGLVASHDGRFGTELSRARVLAGRHPDWRAEDEVAVNERTADELGRGVGDTIRVRTLSPTQLLDIESGFSGRYEGPDLHLRIVGLYRAPADLLGADEIGAVATPAFERRYRDLAGHFDGFYAIDLRGDVGADEITAFEAAAARILPPGEEWGIESAHDAGQPVRDALRVLTTGLLLFAACAGVAGAVAATQALGRQLAVGREDQAALTALGMGRRARAGSFLAPGLLVAVVGGAVTAVVAVAASPLLPIGLARRAEPEPGLAADLVVVAGGAGVVALLVLLRVRGVGVVGEPGLSRRPAGGATVGGGCAGRANPGSGRQP